MSESKAASFWKKLSESTLGRVSSWLVLAGLTLLTPLGKQITKAAWGRAQIFFAWRLTIPGWFFVLLCLIATAVLGIMVVMLYASITGPKDLDLFPYRQYTRDVFDAGVVWEWEYSRSGDVINGRSFCPDDSTELQIDQDPGERETKLICARCKRRFGPFGDKTDDLFTSTRVQIEQRIKTGIWKERV